jgi:hypothetical protein
MYQHLQRSILSRKEKTKLDIGEEEERESK